MKTTTIILFVLFVAGYGTAMAADQNRSKQFNIGKSGLAVKGYDPVSYHTGEALKGSETITADHDGMQFRFVSEANRAAFEANPAKYMPAYGGWCAWAMLEGDKVDINPDRYKIINGQTYLFYDGFFGNTLKKWNKKAEKTPEPDLVQLADDHWRKHIE